jgi:2-polyprenyl-3-methyl-5-hydroxy-6-metoxy-1,4-benzoquinol methylase
VADDRVIDAPPEGAEGWRRVWRERLQYPAGGSLSSFSGIIRRLFGRLFGALLEPERALQRDFNIVTLDLIDDLRNDLRAAQEEIARAHEQIAAARREFRVVAERDDALAAALDQKIESVASRVREVSIPLLVPPERAAAVRDDLSYRRLEERLRGRREEIRASLEPYVELAGSSAPVIDVGCGRGELLAMCRERGIAARGIDSNERSVAELRHEGFDVELVTDAGAFLSSLDRGSAGSIVAAHVVEHLPFGELTALFAGAAHALRPGGLLMIETPNAESIAVAATDFWRDPTHLSPRHVAALVTMGREYGFSVVEAKGVGAVDEAAQLRSASSDPAVQGLVAALNERLYGAPNLRVVLRREDAVRTP